MRLLVAAVFSATTLSGAEQSQLHATAPQDQFDFMIGNWLVRDASGRVIATASVSKAYAGCVLVEKWRGAANSGESLGVIGYQPASRTWHRDYIDNRRVVLSMEGQMEGAAMVMTGKDYQTDITRLHRVTWTPTSGGKVEELWQTSVDDGQSWQDHFFGVFQNISE